MYFDLLDGDNINLIILDTSFMTGNQEDQQLIIILGYLTIIFGIGMVLYPILFGDSDLILALSASYNDVTQLGPGKELYLGFSIIAGALTIAMGLLFTYVGRNYNPDDQKILYATVLQWFVFDSYASLFYGWEYNVILNVLLLGILLGVLYKAHQDALAMTD